MNKDCSPRIYGLIGYPVKHSLSPLMHDAAFAALKINAEYRLFEIKPEELEDFLLKDIPVEDAKGDSFSSQEIAGFNITIPHKVRAFEILKKKFPISFAKLAPKDQYYVKLSGAVNTVKRENGQPLYYNTDAAGFLKSLEDREAGWGLGFATKGKSALVIGSGGAGRAVVAALSWTNTRMKKIYINDIEKSALKAAEDHFFGLGRDDLRDRLEFILGNEIPEVIKKCDLLVNASPVGMKSRDPCVISRDLLHERLSVYDVVYNTETALVKEARAKGLAAAGGKGMLLYQGVAAFELWRDAHPPSPDREIIEIMWSALNEGVKKI